MNPSVHWLYSSTEWHLYIFTMIDTYWGYAYLPSCKVWVGWMATSYQSLWLRKVPKLPPPLSQPLCFESWSENLLAITEWPLTALAVSPGKPRFWSPSTTPHSERQILCSESPLEEPIKSLWKDLKHLIAQRRTPVDSLFATEDNSL